MKTDTLFYTIFLDFPQIFFELINQPDFSRHFKKEECREKSDPTLCLQQKNAKIGFDQLVIGSP
ncbi:MAG: DUF2887 domain-containing protein [Microcystaceae cyanobacterium]